MATPTLMSLVVVALVCCLLCSQTQGQTEQTTATDSAGAAPAGTGGALGLDYVYQDIEPMGVPGFQVGGAKGGRIATPSQSPSSGAQSSVVDVGKFFPLYSDYMGVAPPPPRGADPGQAALPPHLGPHPSLGGAQLPPHLMQLPSPPLPGGEQALGSPGVGGEWGERYEGLRETLRQLRRHGMTSQLDQLQQMYPGVNVTQLYYSDHALQMGGDGIEGGGYWYNGSYYAQPAGGEMEDGYWYNGTYYAGEREGPEMEDGYWYNGTFYPGEREMEDGYWYNGTFYPGEREMEDGYWYNGTFYQGEREMEDGYWYNGTFYYGEREAPEMEDGYWYNGTFYQGEQEGYEQEQEQEDLMWWQLHHPKWANGGVDAAAANTVGQHKSPPIPPRQWDAYGPGHGGNPSGYAPIRPPQPQPQPQPHQRFPPPQQWQLQRPPVVQPQLKTQQQQQPIPRVPEKLPMVQHRPGRPGPTRSGADLSRGGAKPSRGGANPSRGGANPSRGRANPSRSGTNPVRGGTNPGRGLVGTRLGATGGGAVADHPQKAMMVGGPPTASKDGAGRAGPPHSAVKQGAASGIARNGNIGTSGAVGAGGPGAGTNGSAGAGITGAGPVFGGGAGISSGGAEVGGVGAAAAVSPGHGIQGPAKPQIHAVRKQTSPLDPYRLSTTVTFGIVLACLIGLALILAPMACLAYKYRQEKRIKKRTFLRRPETGSVDDGIMDALVMTELGEKRSSRVTKIGGRGPRTADRARSGATRPLTRPTPRELPPTPEQHEVSFT